MSSHWTHSERYVISSRHIVVVVAARAVGEKRPFFAFLARLAKAIAGRLWA